MRNSATNFMLVPINGSYFVFSYWKIKAIIEEEMGGAKGTHTHTRTHAHTHIIGEEMGGARAPPPPPPFPLSLPLPLPPLSLPLCLLSVSLSVSLSGASWLKKRWAAPTALPRLFMPIVRAACQHHASELSFVKPTVTHTHTNTHTHTQTNTHTRHIMRQNSALL